MVCGTPWGWQGFQVARAQRLQTRLQLLYAAHPVCEASVCGPALRYRTQPLVLLPAHPDGCLCVQPARQAASQAHKSEEDEEEADLPGFKRGEIRALGGHCLAMSRRLCICHELLCCI